MYKIDGRGGGVQKSFTRQTRGGFPRLILSYKLPERSVLHSSTPEGSGIGGKNAFSG